MAFSINPGMDIASGLSYYLFIFYDLWQVSSWQTGCITQSKNKTGKKKKKISNKKFILFGWQLDQPTKSI